MTGETPLPKNLALLKSGALCLVLALVLSLGSACGQESPHMPQAAPAHTPTGRPAADLRTYYIRPDGGDAEQCTGLSDTPYPGDGKGRDCAWDHPFRALPPSGTPRILGGDTLIIASGSYMLGLGAPGAANCEPDAAGDCVMPPLPGGPDSAHPTRLLGEGWDRGCPDAPELWGAERADQLLNLAGASHMEISCFELTDHSDCIEHHTGRLACQRDSFPYGPWAAVGLYAEDSADVRLSHLNIHGFAAAGVMAGRLQDWSVDHVRIAANGWVGWEGDIDGDDANSGTLRFRHWVVEWNGCGETWPQGNPIGCWAQTAGGYGDGVGTGDTGGHWIIEDSIFRFNTSDGLDLLYARRPDSSITVRRTLASNNAGDQIKANGPTTIENSILVSRCGYFDGQPFTLHVDPCRAGGSAVALTLRPGDQVDLTGNTMIGEGDCLIIAECDEGDLCDGSERVVLRGNLLLGGPEYQGEGDTTCLLWHDLPHNPVEIIGSLFTNLKAMPASCPAGSLCGVTPELVGPGLTAFDPHLRPGSPAIDAGPSRGMPADDYYGRPRDERPDIGALEWRPEG